jgi:hypothetical protein
MKLRTKTLMFLAFFICTFYVFNVKAKDFSKSQNSIQISSAEKVIGGYLPHYRMNKLSPDVFNYLTHLYYFSLGPSADGEIGRITGLGDFVKAENIASVSSDIETLISQRGSKPVKIFVVIGGWELSDFFDEAAANTQSRANLVANIKNFCIEHQLDGVDLDWEPFNGPVDDTNYGLLVSELREAFKGTELQISVTVGPEHFSLATVLNDSDFVQIMSYGNYFNENTQVAMSTLGNWVDQWIQNGMDKSKLVIGLPAFAKTPDDNAAMIYSEFATFFSLEPDIDWYEYQGKTYYFNNINTINQKTAYMMNNDLGGVMIWELGQDFTVSQTKSLLRNMYETIKTTASVEMDELSTSGFNLFPNPASGKVCLQFELLKPTTIKMSITDISGKVVWQNKEFRMQGKHDDFIDVGNLSNGFYIFSIFDGDSVSQKSFIKK